MGPFHTHAFLPHPFSEVGCVFSVLFLRQQSGFAKWVSVIPKRKLLLGIHSPDPLSSPQTPRLPSFGRPDRYLVRMLWRQGHPQPLPR